MPEYKEDGGRRNDRQEQENIRQIEDRQGELTDEMRTHIVYVGVKGKEK